MALREINMLKDVIISMQTVQNFDDADNNSTIDFMTDGHYSYDDNIGCVTYEESEVTGLPGTRTSVFIMPDQVIVDRDGSLTSRMVFKEGEKTSFLYNTPFGRATMGVDTRKVVHSFDDKGGMAEIEYVVNVEHAIFTRNKLTIQVKQDGGTTCQI